ncbi:capsule assembly Wzi family protein [Pedobacter sp. SYP-B3415]|uniref:capsule assembly Wzi family protein n=1 Tax=Pedobacter sp. SYP-B3415 TaxID=2496641 RepID=UPI00101BEB9D|nr:capsule assembly Wzi family protein [Pedobacter sp. SYP-B3415]
MKQQFNDASHSLSKVKMTKSLCFATFVLAIALLSSQMTLAQNDSLNRYDYNIELRAGATSNDQVPFWLRTNQYGSRPSAGASGGLIFGIRHRYATDSIKKTIDWRMNFESRLNIGRENEFQIIEANIEMRASIFELSLGRSRDLVGIADSTLSSGSFSISGNARGIPKLELSIPTYWTLPFANKWLAIKGDFSYGYMGQYDIFTRTPRYDREHVFSHQKSFYLRIGKPGKRWALSGGFNHNVQFGAEKNQDPNWGLSGFETLWYVANGQMYRGSKVGNHQGSIDQAIDYDFENVHVMAYHQFFYEVGGLIHFNNLKDGLFGISLRNKRRSSEWGWNKAVIELFTSKSQGGELDAKMTPSGDEDYYNNYLYFQGWTYQGENLGNNFLTNAKYIRQDLPHRDKEYIKNNRIYLVHLGLDGYYKSWNAQIKTSFSRNFGTYAISPEGTTTGPNRVIGPPPYFSAVNQFSGYLELNRDIKRLGVNVGGAVAVDRGGLLYNSVGGYLKISKRL